MQTSPYRMPSLVVTECDFVERDALLNGAEDPALTPQSTNRSRSRVSEETADSLVCFGLRVFACLFSSYRLISKAGAFRCSRVS